MGLLTNNGPPDWHPASDSIKEVCKEASDYCKVSNLLRRPTDSFFNNFFYQDRDVELGKLAVYHGLKNSDVVLIGMNNRKLLESNLDVLKNGITEKEQIVYNDVLQ